MIEVVQLDRYGSPIFHKLDRSFLLLRLFQPTITSVLDFLYFKFLKLKSQIFDRNSWDNSKEFPGVEFLNCLQGGCNLS